MFDVEENLGLMQLNPGIRKKKTNYEIHKALNLNTGKCCRKRRKEKKKNLSDSLDCISVSI